MNSLVTVVVVPRERFSYTRESLESLYRNTKPPFKLVYIDGGSPSRIKRYLEAQSRDRGFKLIQTDHYLSPNQARNIAIREVKSGYIVFIDNDAHVAPGWLEALVRCAEETGAWVVAPLYCIGWPEDHAIHVAGGIAHIEEKDGKRYLRQQHRLGTQRAADVRSELRREPSEMAEFHCMLVRSEVFERLGPLDESLLSTLEHIDLCLLVHEAGGSIYFEPESIVTYVPPPPFAWSDLPYYILRWSEAWNQASLQRFRSKWNLSEDDPFFVAHSRWLKEHRQIAFLFRLRSVITYSISWRLGTWMERKIFSPLEEALNRRFVRVARTDGESRADDSHVPLR